MAARVQRRRRRADGPETLKTSEFLMIRTLPQFRDFRGPDGAPGGVYVR